MPFSIPTTLLALGAAAALLGGTIAAAGPERAQERAGDTARDRAHGLLVLAVEQVGTDDQYWSVDGTRTPFGGTLHDDPLDALERASELDLSRFASDGRIALVDADTCLGLVTRTDPTVPRRAVAEPCRDGDDEQEWHVPDGGRGRLQNVGTGLWVGSTQALGGWTMTGSLGASPYRVLTEYLDGRPPAQPRFEAVHDFSTDSITLSGRNGAPGVPVTVSDGFGREQVVTTSGPDGRFTVGLPEPFADLGTVEIRFGDGEWSAKSIRRAAIANPRIAYDPDGTPVLRGIASAYTTVHVGTGPVELDVVATGTSSGSGGVRVPLPDAEPGDVFVVYQRTDGVRSRVAVPSIVQSLIAVDGPETELVRGASTPVPVGLRTTVPVERIASEFTLTAPEGTVFTPGTTHIDGQVKPYGRDWQPSDPRLRIGDVAISADGRTLTASATVTTIAFAEGDEIRWLPTLDVVDPARAPTHV